MVIAAACTPLAHGKEKDKDSGSRNPASAAPDGKTNKAEEEDYAGTPFTEYGEFHSSNEEEGELQFYQLGRFFGASLGVGFEFVDGNRGALWQGGFPSVDFRLHYWFNFNVALELGLMTMSHWYNDISVPNVGKGHVDVNMVLLGLAIKYYFDTKNLSSTLTFANPYVLLGGGSYAKTENSNLAGTQDFDNSLGVSAGVGVEFPVSDKKIYFNVESRIHLITFKDTYTTIYSGAGLPNLTGNFYTITGSFLFTW